MNEPAALRDVSISLLRNEGLAARIQGEDEVKLLWNNLSDVAKALYASVGNGGV